jgi:hypothetical protein
MGLTEQGQRERAIERLLRSGASPQLAARAEADASALCVDGETLAAWSSGALAQADAARVEEHVADCARCQTMLAAFARTEPVIDAPAAWWKRAQIRWLVPLATAATVAAIWVAVPQRNQPAERFESPTPPVMRDSAPAPAAPGPIVRPGTTRGQTASTPATPGASARRELDAAPPMMDAVAPPAAGAGTDKSARAGAAADLKLSARERAADRFAGAEQNQRSAAPSAAPPGTPPPSSPATSTAARAPAPPPAPREASVVVAPETRQFFAKAASEFESPGGGTRWRIVDGQVQRSTTQGKSWEPIALPSPALVTAGHSPAPSVAWVVGRAGAIFVSTDGLRFERVPFPQPLDLAAVLAVDDSQATVTTMDGRVFGTSDRGITWIQP